MPKYIQQTLAWIFAAFFVAAFFFFAHRVHGGSSSVSDVSLMIVTCVAGIQVVALCCMEDYGAALLEKLANRGGFFLPAQHRAEAFGVS